MASDVAQLSGWLAQTALGDRSAFRRLYERPPRLCWASRYVY